MPGHYEQIGRVNPQTGQAELFVAGEWLPDTPVNRQLADLEYSMGPSGDKPVVRYLRTAQVGDRLVDIYGYADEAGNEIITDRRFIAEPLPGEKPVPFVPYGGMAPPTPAGQPTMRDALSLAMQLPQLFPGASPEDLQRTFEDFFMRFFPDLAKQRQQEAMRDFMRQALIVGQIQPMPFTLPPGMTLPPPGVLGQPPELPWPQPGEPGGPEIPPGGPLGPTLPPGLPQEGEGGTVWPGPALLPGEPSQAGYFPARPNLESLRRVQAGLGVSEVGPSGAGGQGPQQVPAAYGEALSRVMNLPPMFDLDFWQRLLKWREVPQALPSVAGRTLYR